jgi:hypothetical protein
MHVRPSEQEASPKDHLKIINHIQPFPRHIYVENPSSLRITAFLDFVHRPVF